MLPRTYGVFGEESSASDDQLLQMLWRRAAELDKSDPWKGPGEAHWWPTAAIEVDKSILPRDIDLTVVSAYAENFADLPPITVQRGTGKLIGGLHRLHAAERVERDHIRVIEVDAADDSLDWDAYADNRRNGAQYTLAQRLAFLQKALLQGRFEGWRNREIAQFVGVSEDTIARKKAGYVTSDPQSGANLTYREPKRQDPRPNPIPRGEPVRRIVGGFDPGPSEPEWPTEESVRASMNAPVDACKDCGAVPASECGCVPAQPVPPPAGPSLDEYDALLVAVETLARIGAKHDGMSIFAQMPVRHRARLLAPSPDGEVLVSAQLLMDGIAQGRWAWKGDAQ